MVTEHHTIPSIRPGRGRDRCRGGLANALMPRLAPASVCEPARSPPARLQLVGMHGEGAPAPDSVRLSPHVLVGEQAFRGLEHAPSFTNVIVAAAAEWRKRSSGLVGHLWRVGSIVVLSGCP